MTRPPIRGDATWDDDPDVDGGRGDGAWDDEWDDEDDAEYEDLRPPASRGRRVLIVVLCIAALLVVAFGGGLWYVQRQLDPPGEPGEPIAFSIPTGSSNAAIADLLEQEGVISSATWFRNYLRVKGEADFLAGEYVLPASSSAWDVVSVLREGPDSPDFATFTVPEGLTIAEYPAAMTDPERGIEAYDAARIQELIASGTIRPTSMPADVTNLEGYLFPDTYQVEAGQDEGVALQRMAAQFDEVATSLRLAETAASVGLTPYEVVTVASLIQEEYGITSEMNRIARVIYNRLDQGIPLGIDATSRYEAVLAGRDRDDIDFESDSPYNSRRIAGLPPTPIAAPGRAALEAALNPEEGPWIFYVRVPAGYEGVVEGGHFFTESNAAFLDAKAECEEAGLGCG
ncbi:MAG: endolytic transglycosylase MltG [Acidimicrobiia bacterium]|nr:endolytic transglycosylase MltG [Acidimicrobiia bacterium]